MACSLGQVDIVRVLLEHGADPHSAPDSADSCWGIAESRAGDAAPEVLRLLESHGATKPMWHMSNDELRDALTTDAPVTREHWFAEEVLAGKTALHHYAGRGETGNALLVIEHGADIDALDDEFRGTPLAWAAAEGHVDTVRMLLGYGANPTLPVNLPQATPLARARRAGHGGGGVRLLEAPPGS